MRELWQLFAAFFRVGMFTFGGGYAMLPMLQKEVVENYKWATEEELMDYYAIGQCTPGVIAVNTATFIGNKNRGIPGGIAATLGVIAPSILIIALISFCLDEFASSGVIQNAFAGIRVCVCVLIFNSVRKLFKSAVKDSWGWAIFLIVFLGAVFTEISTVIFVLFAGAAGIGISLLKQRKGRRQE